MAYVEAIIEYLLFTYIKMLLWRMRKLKYLLSINIKILLCRMWKRLVSIVYKY